MFPPYTDRLSAIREMLKSPLRGMVQEAHEHLYQLILAYKGSYDFDLKLDDVAKEYPTLVRDLEARYHKERGDSSVEFATSLPEDKFIYDVFISYSHKDEDWVRTTLLPTLEKRNLKICIDYRDFIAGKAAIINMQDASEASRHTLLVMTPRWVESEWTLYEGILSRTEDPSGLKRRTIPLLLEKCEPSKFISMLTWVDFTNKKREAEAWQNLFRSLQ
ncbi:MAG: toll/interleukin-1 receptor domain-containing protein [Candidatus Doudnabacteria bacterium]|nr:toll/interleukin-1 receptor domain-containing protein [Candidatus Doudnabacteria bacterium]